MKILVTGNAGFIGFNTAQRLLERGDSVVGFDNVNDYYDTSLKEARLKILEETASRTGSEYHFVRANLADRQAVEECFKAHQFDRVIHHMGFLVMQQSTGNVQIVLVSGGRINAVDEPKSIVHADMHLHAKVPLLALAGLVHLGVASVLAVLGGTRGCDNGGIHDGSLLEHQARISQMAVDCVEDRFAKTPTLQEVTKIEDCGLVGNTLGQAKPGKPAHRLDLIQRIFHRRIAQVVEQLQAMNTKHCRQRIGRTTGPSLVVMFAELFLQLLPRDQRIHLLQKHFTASLAFLGRVFGFGKGQLSHG